MRLRSLAGLVLLFSGALSCKDSTNPQVFSAPTNGNWQVHYFTVFYPRNGNFWANRPWAENSFVLELRASSPGQGTVRAAGVYVTYVGGQSNRDSVPIAIFGLAPNSQGFYNQYDDTLYVMVFDNDTGKRSPWWWSSLPHVLHKDSLGGEQTYRGDEVFTINLWFRRTNRPLPFPDTTLASSVARILENATIQPSEVTATNGRVIDFWRCLEDNVCRTWLLDYNRSR